MKMLEINIKSIKPAVQQPAKREKPTMQAGTLVTNTNSSEISAIHHQCIAT